VCVCVGILYYRQVLGSAYLSGRRHAPTHDFRVGDQHLSQCLSCGESDLSTPRPHPPHVSPHRVTSQCHTCMMAGCTRRDRSGCRRQRRHRRREDGWATQPLAICDRGGGGGSRLASRQAGGAVGVGWYCVHLALGAVHGNAELESPLGSHLRIHDARRAHRQQHLVWRQDCLMPARVKPKPLNGLDSRCPSSVRPRSAGTAADIESLRLAIASHPAGIYT
jgi:hypothetical protein